VFNMGWTVLVGMIIFIGGSFAPSVQAALLGQLPLFFACGAIGLVAMVLTRIFQGRLMPVLPIVGLLFGLAFPAAAVAGKLFSDWKREAVFKFAFLPPSDAGRVDVAIDLPSGASLAATQRVVERLEGVIQGHPEVHYVVSSLGTRTSGFAAAQRGTNYAAITVTLYDKAALLDSLPWVKHEERLRTVPDTQVAAELLERVGGRLGQTGQAGTQGRARPGPTR
jgi:HAE1 family hydrophobic/amphiphilic exporter-1